MLVLGFSGGLDLANESIFGRANAHRWHGIPVYHDAAAVLLEDGKLVAAIEQERLDRIKHSDRFPVDAMRWCLEHHGVTLKDLDAIAYAGEENVASYELATLTSEPWFRVPQSLEGCGDFISDVRVPFRHRLAYALGGDVSSKKLCFVPHHVAHAASAYHVSGFERCLVVTLDGVGDGESGVVMLGEGGKLKRLRSLTPPLAKSVGFLYSHVTSFLGFKPFDEYKVMGLAPYGDPTVYRDAFRVLYTLHPDGEYELHLDRFPHGLLILSEPRKPGDPMEKRHHDIAAALQVTLETIVLHMLEHLRKTTGEKYLAVAGGVGHNCTMNGRILESGLFEEAFFQPVAHDGGGALGAALQATRDLGGHDDAPKSERLTHLYWGRELGTDAAIADRLEAWGGFFEFERVEDVERKAAELLAGGNVIGWAQGRSEYGPRALGNRSILADPRPPENKEIINAMVKKREGFRPFAPAVLQECASEFFVMMADDAPFMIHTVAVQQDKRELLGAVTHVDGSARVQTVSRETNPRYWDLIKAFQEITEVPIVLNTSFNNNAEPIVDSVDDVLVCVLTTAIEYAVVGDYLVKKRPESQHPVGDLVVRIPRHIHVTATSTSSEGDGKVQTSTKMGNIGGLSATPISAAVAQVLGHVDGKRTVDEVIEMAGDVVETPNEARLELVELWGKRLVALHPR